MIPDIGAFSNLIGEAQAAKAASEQRDKELADAIKRVEEAVQRIEKILQTLVS